MNYDDWKCTPPNYEDENKGFELNEELEHLYREVARLKEENETLRTKLKTQAQSKGQS